MPGTTGGSRALLRALRSAMAGAAEGQARLDTVVGLIASNMVAEVCSIYLKRDENTLELCATEGLRQDSVHSARLRVGQGLVGRIAERAEPFATDDAENAPGFRYLPETGEERYRSFVGVPIQRLGEMMGVLVVQNEAARLYEDDDIEALEFVAMIIAEMTEAGAFLDSAGLAAGPGRRQGPLRIAGKSASDGLAEGPVHLHEPRLVNFDPIADDPAVERARMSEALIAMRGHVDQMLAETGPGHGTEQRDIFEAYRMVAYDKGWSRRLMEAIDSGLSAEVAVEKVQSDARARMERVADPYLRERLHDLDDLANRLLRHLIKDEAQPAAAPEGAILVARNLGPGELMDHAGHVRGVVLEEGSLSSHAAIVARALTIPMVVQAERITRDANNGDQIIVNGDTGRVHLRPEPVVLEQFQGQIAEAAEAREAYRELVGLPAQTRDGVRIELKMNAGVLADLPSLAVSGAEGVGLYRTELQFMIRQRMPRREAQAALYARVMDAAAGREVIFRTLDIGSDKVLPYMRREREANPAMGWRAIRVGLDRPKLLSMQIQALIRAAKGRPLSLMFPMIAEASEFYDARDLVEMEIDRQASLGHARPSDLKIGLMFEVPSLVAAPDRLFEEADFVSVGGNDLLQFFFAADRENERVRGRYGTLSLSFLDFLSGIVARCARHGTRLSFCGEAAGQPVSAAALAAIGFRELSMRAASIGPVKQALIGLELEAVRAAIDGARRQGLANAEDAVAAVLRGQSD